MKFYLVSVLLFCLSGWAVGAEDAKPVSVKAAGVIAFAVKDKRTHLLLANHQGLAFYRGYGAFGGGIEGDESIETAALREFHEETGCAFKGQKITLREEHSLQLNNYVSFIVELPYIEEEVLLRRQQNSGCEGAVFRERGVLRWFTLALVMDDKQRFDIETSLESPPWHIWSAAKHVIEKAIKQKLIPVQTINR